MIESVRNIPGRWLPLVLGFVVLAALTVRVAPLIDGGDRLQRQCVSEDGYLMLTIARNMALGNGFSVSGGTVASNGTQPLTTLLYAFCFWSVEANRQAGLYVIVGLQFLTALATAFLIFRFTRTHLYKGPHAEIVALVAAAAWFASPTSLMHSQNGLETGLCTLLILCSIALYDRLAARFAAGFSLAACLLLGAVLGITFLGRNDACFLIAVMLVIHLIQGARRHYPQRALAQALLIGTVSVAVASPWLWFNITRFGHPVPVSGRAEALNVAFGHNFTAAFVALVENSLLFVRIPDALQYNPMVALACALLLAAGVLIAVSRRRWLARHFSTGMAVLAGFVAALFIYYGLFFGMPSFLGRYYFPAVMLSAIVSTAVLVNSWVQSQSPIRRRPLATAGAAIIVLCLAFNTRLYLNGKKHLHFQVVDWVRENVPEETWVAAVQTGTLGFYHDRTINLDGKVDPNAFAAAKENRIAEYIVERDVEYIVDWAGIAAWGERPEFAANYKLTLKDDQRNLAVLQRRVRTTTMNAPKSSSPIIPYGMFVHMPND